MEGETSDPLQFKPWLIQQVSSGKFLDLEWIDAEKKRIFKLPWTKKNYPHWEEHHEIFRAWAKHRARCRNDRDGVTQHISLMKSNFRTILRKCQDIEELKDFHQLGLQTGNYKVFKVLTPEEVHAKKMRAKQVCVEEPTNTEDIVEIIASEEPSQQLPLLASPHIEPEWINASSSMGVLLLESPSSKRSPPPSVEVPVPQKVKKTRISNPPEDARFSAREVIFVHADEVPMETEHEHAAIADIGENTQGFHILLEAAQMKADAGEDHAMSVDDWAEMNLLKLLDTFGISHDELYMYELLIKYDQTQVLCETYAKMNHGYRLHYGNHLDQRLMVRIDEPKRSELILDFEREPITLPDPSFTVSSSLATVLKNTDAGVVLKADDKFQLFGKRLCQSRVFAFSSFAASEQTSTPIKMDREKEISLFSYQKFLESWYACLQHKTALPDHTVYLSFGKMPQERSSKVFISAKLIPKAAESLKTALESQRDWSEVLVSSEKSIDKTIRLGELLN